MIWEYLAEARRMIAGSDVYEVLSHIDYAVRSGRLSRKVRLTHGSRGVFRLVMRDLAGSGRALELNVGGPLRPWIPQWWREEGGRAITFASDAHTTDALARPLLRRNGNGRALRLPPRPSAGASGPADNARSTVLLRRTFR